MGEVNHHDAEGIIRPLNLRNDLAQVADLIELCFMGNIDEDGQDYIRYLRTLSRSFLQSSWGFSGVQQRYASLQGFVFEVNGKIYGNLSMLPFYKNGDFIYLIANVAVHPAYRRQGIALSLTQEGLKYASKKAAKSAWLQVRVDNPAAYTLYKKMGFQEKTRRTTWTLKPQNRSRYELISEVKILPRKRKDWTSQRKNLLSNYPEDVRWNLGLKPERFKPGFLPWLDQFLNEKFIYQFSAYVQQQWIGSVSLERTNLFADNLWVACSPDWDDHVLRTLVPFIRKKLLIKRPMSVNYAENRADSTFDILGFEKNHSLIWMEADTHIPIHFQV